MHSQFTDAGLTRSVDPYDEDDNQSQSRLSGSDPASAIDLLADMMKMLCAIDAFRLHPVSHRSYQGKRCFYTDITLINKDRCHPTSSRRSRQRQTGSDPTEDVVTSLEGSHTFIQAGFLSSCAARMVSPLHHVRGL